MFSVLFPVIAPVFVCAAIGYGWAKSGRPYDTEMVTTLMVIFATPCLLFSTLVSVELDFAKLGMMAGAAAAALASFVLFGAVYLYLTGLSLRGFLPSLAFPNTGNMGLPLCLLAFGDEGLALAIIYFTVSAGAQFVFGPAIAAGNLSFAAFVRSPMLWAVACALVLLFAGIEPPKWIANTTHIIGGMTVPMMLITLGVSLARLRVQGLGRAVGISFVRLGIGFAVGVGLAEAFGMEGTARGVMILESAMPVAVFNYLFAERYKVCPEDVAGAVMVSTALSFLTLPALVWYVV